LLAIWAGESRVPIHAHGGACVMAAGSKTEKRPQRLPRRRMGATNQWLAKIRQTAALNWLHISLCASQRRGRVGGPTVPMR
jgi:hypothetical protein